MREKFDALPRESKFTSYYKDSAKWGKLFFYERPLGHLSQLSQGEGSARGTILLLLEEA